MRVSVITITYNAERWLERTMQSVLAQSCKDYEYIIVDGGSKDGTIDIIATDHAPHTEEEKSRGLEKSPFGITGIELAFPLLYTGLVKKGIITLDKLIDLLVVRPREIFGIPYDGFSIWNLEEEFEVTKEMFLSQGKATPFIGEKLYGVNYLTVCNNHIVYEKEEGK